MSGSKTLQEIARAQFAEQRRALLSFTVPEWGDAKIYFYAHQNHAENAAITRHVNHLGQVDPDGVITLVQTRARDQDGNLIWGPNDVNNLKTKYDPVVLRSISNHITAHTVMPDEGEERKKK